MAWIHCFFARRQNSYWTACKSSFWVQIDCTLQLQCRGPSPDYQVITNLGGKTPISGMPFGLMVNIYIFKAAFLFPSIPGVYILQISNYGCVYGGGIVPINQRVDPWKSWQNIRTLLFIAVEIYKEA